jgi:hypothetical protein
MRQETGHRLIAKPSWTSFHTRQLGEHTDTLATLRARMHEPVPQIGHWLGRVLNGFYQYHAVPGNWASLYRFRERIGNYWMHALKRRSQKNRLSAERSTRLCRRWLPRLRLVHPYPDVRFDASHPRYEPYALAALVRICAGGGQR